ncbi:hypothetical protein T440DRAFT_473113 [Plenodomus tracheiphilus IPT5]|uniref:Uncharacterized protein n=1 Tax=Plenodomus tracheiphilus IPT5 TaxID=1408161 RepID=A0A6A7ANG5_9PLEO|nr:hypothetical protein T440DRAFT_473113 [Plenodomus tracheiphilus IPT5]
MPADADSDCCGDMCCDTGLVCARGSYRPQCWPKAGKEDNAVVPGASPTVKRDQSGTVRARATTVHSTWEPESLRNGSARSGVSSWMYGLLMLTNFATLISATGLAEPKVGEAKSEPTTTFISSISLSTAKVEVGDTGADEKGGGGHAAARGGGRGGARTGADSGGHSNGAGSKSTSVETMWPLMLLTLPQLLGPLAVANLVAGSATFNTPEADVPKHGDEISEMSTNAAGTPVPELAVEVDLSEKKRFRLGGGGGRGGGVSLGADIRPKGMTMLMVCALPLFASLALVDAYRLL